MKLRRIAVLLAMLAGCGSRRPAAPPTVEPPPPVAPPVLHPAIGTWGFDTSGMDRSIEPGASFFRYANGGWLAATQIPADKSNYGMFTMLSDVSDERVRAIAEAAAGPPGSDGQRIGDYYKSFMDEAAIEAKGLAPIQPWLDDIAKIKDANGVVLQLARRSRQLGASPLTTSVAQDDRAPETYVPVLSQGGLGLPDRDMYDDNKPQFAALREGYQGYILRMFTLIGLKQPEARAQAVYGLEAQLARTHWTRVQNRDPQRTYNKMAIADLMRIAPGIDWKRWLDAVGLAGQPAINVYQPSAITGAARLLQSQPLAVWRDYLVLHALSDAAPYLPKQLVDAHFEMFDKTLSGTPELRARWKRAVDEVSGTLGEAVGQLYVAKHFTPETKARADQLVKNVLAAMGQRLDALPWMSAATKAKAKQKLATYRPKIGYPRTWRDYRALTITAGDALGNAQRAAQFEYDRQLAKLGQPVDRDEWGITPMTVNAYYSPALNEIVFPAAVLQPPFFDAGADDAVNYGAIGTGIGHEISHGFDDQGAQYDASGALANWWTRDDSEKFKAATARLVAQYGAYCPFPASDGHAAQCVNGKLTLGENIADLAGLTVAYSAYQISLGGKPAPVIDGLTGDQRFFLGFAQIWRRLYREQEMANRLVTDPHSPSEYRVSVVRNLDAWYDAFAPAPNDALFLAPDQRVKIW